jgi:DNA-binding transcriptional ArsR family regulator
LPKRPRRRPNSRAIEGPASSAPIFAALGDQTRLRLVTRLSEGGPLSIANLTTGSRVTRQAITKHLRVLEGAGLVRSRRRGRESLWQLEQRRLHEVRRYLDQISAQWDQALGRLRNFVEG